MLLILLDLVVSRKGVLLAVGVLGLALSAVFTFVLWGDLGSEPTGQMQGIFGTLVVDRFSLFFKLVLAAAALLRAPDFRCLRRSD